MLNQKRALSVAAAVALGSSVALANYLPLTSDTDDNRWVLFGVSGFHADGATAGAGGTGAIEAGMFRITDDSDNVARDTGADDLYGEEGATPTGEAITKGGNVLASVKRVDGVDSEVEVRVDVSAINFQVTDPVRTIYVQTEEDNAPVFAFSYRSALEGERLEFSTTSSGATDNAYYIIINSENTYQNPAIGTYIPETLASGGEDADDGILLRSIDQAVDYDFTNNPVTSRNYLRAEHQDTAGAADNLRLYAYDPTGIWQLYDSRNSFNDFTELQRGKGYWGKMDLTTTGATPAGFVLGRPSITTDDYINNGVTHGWNLLAFNAINPDLRIATTGLVIAGVGNNGNLILEDVSGNHSVTIAVLAADADAETARKINHAVKQAKINGTIPNKFNIVAMANATGIVLVSNEKFTIKESAANVLEDITTLANHTPLNSDTLETHADTADVTGVDGAMSLYGEYALVLDNPGNDAWATLQIRCDADNSTTIVPTAVGIGASVCVDATHVLDTSDFGYPRDLILAVGNNPFEVRDHTFTRVFDYTARADAGELTFVNADAGITTADILASQPAVYELNLTGLVINSDGTGDELLFDGTVVYTATATPTLLGDIFTALDGSTVTLSDGIDYDISGTDETDIVLTAQTAVTNPIGAPLAISVIDNGGTAAVNATNPNITQTQAGLDAPTAQEVVTEIALAAEFTDGANILAVGDKIIFRMKVHGSNEFRVLETGDADNLTPSTTTSLTALGAISHVFSPNYFAKAEVINSTEATIADVGAGVAAADETIAIVIETYYNPTLALADYTTVVGDTDPVTFYANLASHINSELNDKGINANVSIDNSTTPATFVDAEITLTGPDIIEIVSFTHSEAQLTAAITSELGGISLATAKGDLVEDLKYNFVQTPNYVLNGPLYEMKAAGFTAKAMVTGTSNLSNGNINWDGIDLTRKPSEWLNSQDYNLFGVSPQSGYWTYLEPAAPNPLSFEATPFAGNYSQHFNHDGATFNNVAGAIEVTVNGISEYDDRKSARVVAIVGGSEVELSRDGDSNVYTAQISSHELKELTAGRIHDIQVAVADGLGYRIPATSTGSVVDFKAPQTPVLTFVDGTTLSITNPAEDGVTKYYVYRNNIPALNTEAAKLFAIDAANAAAYNICATPGFTRTGSYDLKFFAIDGTDLSTSNASNVVSQDGYMPLFKNSAVASNTKDVGDATTSIAQVKYNNSCVVDTAFTSDSSIQVSSLTNFQTVKVAYEPRVTGDAVMITAHVSGGTENTRLARITYHPDYVGDTVFIQLGTRVYSYVLPNEATAVGSTEASPLNISAGYLPGQSLGE